MRYILTVLSLLILPPAFAGDPKPPPPPDPDPVSMAQRQDQVQDQHQHQDQHQSQVLKGGVQENHQLVHANDHSVHKNDQRVHNEATAGDSSASADNDQSVVVKGDHHPRQAPAAFAGYGNTTATCFRTYGLGGSNSTGGISLGWPFKDGDCALAEAAKMAFAQRNVVLGWKLYCNQKTVLKVYGAKRWRNKTREAARNKCLSDAGVVRGAYEEDLQKLRAEVDSKVIALYNLNTESISDVEKLKSEVLLLVDRLVHVESLAHSEGKGMHVETVRKIAREEHIKMDCEGASKMVCEASP